MVTTVGARSTQEDLTICQPEEVLVSSWEIWFLGYVMSLKDIHMEEKIIEAIR